MRRRARESRARLWGHGGPLAPRHGGVGGWWEATSHTLGLAAPSPNCPLPGPLPGSPRPPSLGSQPGQQLVPCCPGGGGPLVLLQPLQQTPASGDSMAGRDPSSAPASPRPPWAGRGGWPHSAQPLSLRLAIVGTGEKGCDSCMEGVGRSSLPPIADWIIVMELRLFDQQSKRACWIQPSRKSTF